MKSLLLRCVCTSVVALGSLASAQVVSPGQTAITGSNTAAAVLSHSNAASAAVAAPWQASRAQSTAKDIGAADIATKMDIVLLLNRAPVEEQALSLYNAEVMNDSIKPVSGGEFTETFGLAVSDMQSLSSWLESGGFKVVTADGGRRYVLFNGTAAQVAKFFGVPVHEFVSSDGVKRYGVASAPQVPAWLAPYARGFRGLDNFGVVATPNFDGVVTMPKQRNAAKVDNEGSQTEKPAPDGVIEFHTAGSVITSSLDPADQTDAAVARRASVHPDSLLTTNTSVSLGTNPINYGSTQSDLITGTISWSGTTTPTGTITFYDSDGYLGAQILLTSSSCTLGSGSYTCNYTWTGASAATPSPDTIYAVYSGDTNYASSSGTTTLTITTNKGGGNTYINIATFTDTPATQAIATPPANGVAVVVESGDLFSFGGAPTGTLLVAGNGGIGSIYYNATNAYCGFLFIYCIFDNTFTWGGPANPGQEAVQRALLPGQYTLTAAYSGNTTYESSYQDATYTVTGSGNTATTTAVTANPNFVNTTNPGTTFTTTTTWSGSAAAPTGNLQLSYTGTGVGAAVFPITGAVNSIGSGNYDGGVYTYTYQCTTAATGSGGTITCTITDANLYALLAAGANTITATYYGDTVYKSSSGTTTVTKSNNTTSATAITTVSPATVTYGEETGGETYTITVQGSGGAYPTGTLTVTTTNLATNAVLGTQTTSVATCTASRPGGAVYRETCTVVQPVPATTPGGTYAVVAKYSGDANYNGSTSAQNSFVINPQAMTLGASSITPNPIAANTSTPLSLSQVVNWIGSGNPPTAGNFSFTLNGTKYPATCTTSGDSDTCTAAPTVNLNAGSYPVTFSFTADGNYTLTTTTIGTLVVTSGANLSISIACTTSTSCGSTTLGTATVGITATVKNSATGAASPTGSVTLTDSTTGQTYTATLVPGTGGSQGTSTAAFTISTGVAGGINTFTGTYSGDSALTSNSLTAYVAGLLVSIDLKHTFSIDPGVVEGSPVCANPPSSGQVPGSNCTQGYGVQVYNFTSATQTFSLSFVNAASGAFSYQSSCGTSIAANATCELIFYYNPPFGDGTGSPTCTPVQTCGFYEQGTWAIAGNSGTLTGVGIKSGSGLSTARSGATSFPAILAGKAVLSSAAPISATPLTLSFGPLGPNQLSGSQNVTVTNTSTAPASLTYTLPGAPFTVVNNCPASLAGGAQCTITVSAKSASVGSFTGSIVITPGGGGSAITVNLSASVVNNNGITLNANSHSFGVVTVNSTSTFALGVTNSSSSTQTISFSNTAGAGFTVNSSGCPASLASGAQCTVTVTYAPTATGSSTDTLAMSSSAIILPGGTSSAPYTNNITFSGTASASNEFTATTSIHDWGQIPVGSAGTNYGVVLTNGTSTALTLTLGGGSFTTTTGFSIVTNNCPATLAVNASCNLVFGFTPVAEGYVTTTYPISATNTGGTSVPLYSLGSQVSGIVLSGTGN